MNKIINMNNTELKAIELKATELSKKIDAINQKYFGVFDEAITKEKAKLESAKKSIYGFRKIYVDMRALDETVYQDRMLKSKLAENDAQVRFNEAVKAIEILRHQKIKDCFFNAEMVEKRQYEAEFSKLQEKYKIESKNIEDDKLNEKGKENREYVKYLQSIQTNKQYFKKK